MLNEADSSRVFLSIFHDRASIGRKRQADGRKAVGPNMGHCNYAERKYYYVT